MTDNMDLEMDMKMDSNSAIHTPMMKMMSSTSSSSSSSDTLTQQHRRNNKKHLLNKNTPPLNRNDYMVAEHKTLGGIPRLQALHKCVNVCMYSCM